MSGEWNAALTCSGTIFLTPAFFASSEARSSASRVPDSTICPGELKFAAARSRGLATAARTRSEEHTSELQSLTNLVCRLLLEKKKYMNHDDASFINDD